MTITDKKTSLAVITIMFAITGVIITVILSKIKAFDSDQFDIKIPTPLIAGKLRKFKNGAVAGDDAVCAEIGKSILKKNGSAVDSVIAASLCTSLGFMQSMGIGGGFVMTIYDKATEKAYYLNARDRAPLRAHEDMFKDKSEASLEGALAVAVPGEIAGYWAAHQRFGKLPWADLFTDAIALCEKGWELSQIQLNDLLKKETCINKDPTLRSLFVNETTKKLKKSGSIIKADKLCKTYKVLAGKGADEFYNGTLGRTLIEDLRKHGGILTMDDLSTYSAKWQEPLETELSDGLKLFTSNFPTSGALLIFIMNIFDEFKFNPNSLNGDENTIKTYHRMIETFKYAFAVRSKLGDPEFHDMTEVMHQLKNSRDYARAIKARIDDTQTWNDAAHYEGSTQLHEDHGTSHLVVLSPTGDAVSLTSTINTPFGSCLVGEKTGILFNNNMDDFSIPTVVNYFGLPGNSEKNSIQPGKKPLSSMAPSILVDTNRNVKMIIAASGGTRIISSLACVLARVLWMGNTIKEAIDTPRLHHQLLPMMINYEFGTSNSVIQGLKNLGHQVSQDNYQAYSFVAAIFKSTDFIFANSDFRRNGDACGI